VIGLGVGFLVATVCYTNFYLPYASPEAEAARDRAAVTGVPGKGSTWSNLAKARDAQK
jgi:hypothetical protein